MTAVRSTGNCPYCNDVTVVGAACPPLCGPNCVGVRLQQSVTFAAAQAAQPLTWPVPTTCVVPMPVMQSCIGTTAYDPFDKPMRPDDVERIARRVVDLLDERDRSKT